MCEGLETGEGGKKQSISDVAKLVKADYLKEKTTNSQFNINTQTDIAELVENDSPTGEKKQ